MQETKLEVGAIFEGKVTGITKFGAFVDLGGGKTGMVHISEVAPVFVKEIRDFVTEGQTVKVKIIGINDDGKISLSMKKADENAQQHVYFLLGFFLACRLRGTPAGDFFILIKSFLEFQEPFFQKRFLAG